MKNNSFISPAVDSVFKAYIECHVEKNYKDILSYIEKIEDINKRKRYNETFKSLVTKVHIEDPIEFNLKCIKLVKESKISKNIVNLLAAVNRNIKGNPDLNLEPFYSLISKRLITFQDTPSQLNAIAEGQKCLLATYAIVICSNEDFVGKRSHSASYEGAQKKSQSTGNLLQL